MRTTMALVFYIASISLHCAAAQPPAVPADDVAAAPEPVPRSAYLEFAREGADWVWSNYSSLESRWKDTLDPDNVFGYRPPPRFLEMAVIYAKLYELEGNETYAKRAKKVLLTYGEYRAAYPKEAIERRADYWGGLPALPDFFTTMRYIRAYETLKQLEYVSGTAEKEKIEGIIVESLDYLLRTQEWGAMNRAMLRAETLAWAVRAMPGHPAAKKWRTYERALSFDNRGNWEIEDATIYHAVWLYALLGHADARNDMAELFDTPEMYYYARYFLNLISPDGCVPDFGDANFRANWSRYLVYFEAAASAYGNPHLKWAAANMAEKFLDLGDPQRTGLAYLMLDCYRYATDDVAPEPPEGLSMEVMEDVQGKKVVFRTGWQPDSTYMLLNYRDEGDGGLLFRDYLRDTIPVEEEKMTHGHADENSVVMLMSGGALLLHDGGYRDYMPSGPFGAFRQDYFHNRLCVRQEKIFMGQAEGEWRYSIKGRAEVPGQSVLGFLRNAGSYRPVRTQKVDFLTFPDIDYSRTRLIDEKMDYEWDRAVVFLKEPALFLVFDVFKAGTEAYFTASNLWHTRKIVSRGEHWYDTVYDRIGETELCTDTHLLIHFPETHFRLEGVEVINRHYQDELMIHQTAAQHFELGEHIGFVTALKPHSAGDDPTEWVARIRCEETDPKGAGMLVCVETGGRTIRVGVKCDMRMDMVRDWRRPRYTYEAGRILYGPMETNSDLFVAERKGDELSYTAVNMTKAVYNGQLLFDQPQTFFGLAFDGSEDTKGVSKVRYWRDKAVLGVER